MKRVIIIGLAISTGLVIFIAPFASKAPDGLEKVAEDKGFIHNAFNFIRAPIPDYLIPFIKNEFISTSLAGLLGLFITFIIAYGIGHLLKP